MNAGVDVVVLERLPVRTGLSATPAGTHGTCTSLADQGMKVLLGHELTRGLRRRPQRGAQGWSPAWPSATPRAKTTQQPEPASRTPLDEGFASDLFHSGKFVLPTTTDWLAGKRNHEGGPGGRSPAWRGSGGSTPGGKRKRGAARDFREHAPPTSVAGTGFEPATSGL
jgi:hypothetical protein